MATPEKENDHEIPDLAGLESENIIVRKKGKESRKTDLHRVLRLKTRNGSRNVKDNAKGRLPKPSETCRSEITGGNQAGITRYMQTTLSNPGIAAYGSVPALNEGRITPLWGQENRAVIP